MTTRNNAKWMPFFLAHNSDIGQNIAVVEYMGPAQMALFQKAANDILQGKIPLNSNQFRRLFHFQDFIRKLGRGELSPKQLGRKIFALIEICCVLYPPDEIRKKIDIATYGRVGKSEKISSSEKHFEDCGSRTINSNTEYTNETDDESNWEEGISEDEYEEEETFENNGEENEDNTTYNKFTS